MRGKKLLISLSIASIIIISAAMFAAFEAHIINVTAKIENALNVPIEEIDFGTVFPQEEIDKNLDITLSDSFKEEDRVNNVKYIIRQKPKCGITTDDGKVLVGETKSGHVVIENGEMSVDCGVAPRDLETGESWGQLPLLCPYLSKHKDDTDLEGNDEELSAFHPIGYIDVGDNLESTEDDEWVWTDVKGYLDKKEGDIEDKWVIDLKAPCFGDYCAQDWKSFVNGINPNVNPDDYVQPIENEHKIFGCDLWIEVYGISLGNGDIGCENKADVMMILDRSNSIDVNEMITLKNSAKSFVDALAPAADKVHIGQSSFATLGTLDLHLSDDVTSIKNAIDALTPSGFTNLKEGIELATTELGGGDGHDRTDATSPDYMVIITDGSPNRPLGGDPLNDAIVAANAAKAAGTTIYVVGVGTSQQTADYLKNNIASSVNHYFDASDFGDLQVILEELADCNLQ